ncbi:MAG: hypothetical protein IH935_09005, partial [Acidobacteria bacterium]|nr:hypothetical protein [Acidobacteriota bacterium]
MRITSIVLAMIALAAPLAGAATLHAQQLPDTLPVAPQLDYRIPPYDVNAFLIEAE